MRTGVPGGGPGPLHPPATTTRDARRRAEDGLPRPALRPRGGADRRRRYGLSSAKPVATARPSGKGLTVSGIDTGLVELSRRDRLSQWVFWSLWSTIILIAAAFYYDKANDHRSAFVRWRPQVLQFAQGVNIYEQDALPHAAADADHALSADGAADRRRGDVLVRAQGRDDQRGAGPVLPVRPAARRALSADVPVAGAAAEPAADPGRPASRE